MLINNHSLLNCWQMGGGPRNRPHFLTQTRIMSNSAALSSTATVLEGLPCLLVHRHQQFRNSFASGGGTAPTPNPPAWFKHETVSCPVAHPHKQLRHSSMVCKRGRGRASLNPPAFFWDEAVPCRIGNLHQQLPHALMVCKGASPL